MRNEQSTVDVRGARTGKDALIYNGDGVILARIDEFHSQATFNNVGYTPLGCTIELEAPNTSGISITFNEIVIEDEVFFVDMFNYMGEGKLPDWSMQATLLGDEDDNEERVKYDHCVPSGAIDIQNLTVGDVIKRAWSLHVNAAPKLTSTLTYNR